MPAETVADRPVPNHARVESARDAPGRSRRLGGRRRSALWVFAIAAAAVIAWLSSPVAIGVFLGTLMAFTMDAFYQELLVRRWRPSLAAFASVGLAMLGVVATSIATGYLLLSRGVAMAGALLASLGPDGEARAFILKTTAHFPQELQVATLLEKLRGAAAGLAARAGLIAGAVLNATFSGVLAGLFMVLT